MNLNVEDYHVKDCITVDDHQLLSTKKLPEKVKLFVSGNDRWLSVDFIAESIGISTGSTYLILTENLLTNKLLHDGCRMFRRWIALKHLPVFRVCLMKIRTTLFQDFVTVDVTWLHHFDPESKIQSMAWKHVTSPPPRKFCMVMSAH